MPVEQIDIEKFLLLSETIPVADVRSPGEFSKGHIPGALSLPLFTDEERKIIGTEYKQQSREIAVNTGLHFFSERMKVMYSEAVQAAAVWGEKKEIQEKKSLQYFIVHCWRGGMRSGAAAWLLSLYGARVYTLKGGYKVFRSWALAVLEKKYDFKIIGGYTGSGKTQLLKKIQANGNCIIDLEKLASHKGSAFGSLGEDAQPSQEMFENILAMEIYKARMQKKPATNNIHANRNTTPVFWLEDESRNIGTITIPANIWLQMRNSSIYFIDIPFEERLNYLIKSYGLFNKNELQHAILKIQKRLGGLDTKNALLYLAQNNIKECFAILLRYYDKYYERGLFKRENLQSLLNKIPCANVDINNAQTLLSKVTDAV